VDSRTGSLVVTGHKDRLQEVDGLVAHSRHGKDVQVDIEARIMLVSLDKAREYGIRVYGQDLDGSTKRLRMRREFPISSRRREEDRERDGKSGRGRAREPRETTGNYLEVLQPNIQVQALVRALESDSDTKVLSSPQDANARGRPPPSSPARRSPIERPRSRTIRPWRRSSSRTSA